MSVHAALEVLIATWWQTFATLPEVARVPLVKRLTSLPDEPAFRDAAHAELLLFLTDQLPADHAVLVAARHDETRGTAAETRRESRAILAALASVSLPATSPELSRLAPDDVGIAAGLQGPWHPGDPVTPETALKLWQVDRLLRRIRRASGAERLDEWFVTASTQLHNRSPRDVAASGDLSPLAQLAEALETFSVS